MQRMPYADIAKCPEHIQKLISTNPLNMIRMCAHATPEVFEGFYKFGSGFFAGSKLAADLKEIAILRAGYHAEASYEYIQHESMARGIGMSDAVLAAVKKGGKHPGVLSDIQQAVMDFADEVIVDVRVSDATLANIRKHLSDQLVVDLIFLIGFYMMVSRLLETTGVPLDAQMMTLDKMTDLAKQADNL
jgi:alkylhydroperoxidase family enzyme